MSIYNRLRGTFGKVAYFVLSRTNLTESKDKIMSNIVIDFVRFKISKNKRLVIIKPIKSKRSHRKKQIIADETPSEPTQRRIALRAYDGNPTYFQPTLASEFKNKNHKYIPMIERRFHKITPPTPLPMVRKIKKDIIEVKDEIIIPPT